MAMMIMIAPIKMKGLLRPHDILERSLMTPTTGLMMEPHIGAAVHMSEVCSSDIPSECRYEVPCEKMVNQTVWSLCAKMSMFLRRPSGHTLCYSPSNRTR